METFARDSRARTSKKPRKTKIVCTLGPASSSDEMIQELVGAGMDVARLNFSHGDYESHRRTIRTIRRLSSEAGKEVGILQDLRGPRIRIGDIAEAQRVLRPEEKVYLVPHETEEPDTLPIQYPYLLEDAKVGDRILLADGSVELLIEEKQSDKLICRVLVGGEIQSRKGVNLPASPLRIPAFTEKDRADLAVGLEEGVDFVALSFVRHERDLEPVIEILSPRRPPPLLIAKIETPQGLERLDAILERVDGIMVARGDLGVEMPLAEVPLIQKRLIQAARKVGKPVITATQMLRSMVDSPQPTRAEAADVANAILDGTDAVMLSEESAIGRFPREAVQVLNRVALATEPYVAGEVLLQEPISEHLPPIQAAVSRSACWLARDLEAAVILAFTASGSTARTVARFRTPYPLIALTPHRSTQRQLALSWGVTPVLVDFLAETDDIFSVAKSWALQNGVAAKGDRIILTTGIPPGVPGTTNLLKVIEME